MYEIITFSLDLRREDDFSPLIGIRFKDGKKNKLFSLLVQKYDITWSERYKCYILPDETLFNGDLFKEYLKIIDSSLEIVFSNHKIDIALIEKEQKQSYYTKPSLVNILASYINNTCTEKSILLDPAAGIGNLTDKVKIPKENIYLVEPDNECVRILKEKGYKHVIHGTFEEYLEKRKQPEFTHIIMNPPFKNRTDLFFFNECFKLLSEEGRIAAVISENSIYEELEPLGYTFDIDFPSSKDSNNFEGVSDLLQEFIANTHNTNNCLMDITTSFCDTNARAYYLLAEKRLIKK